VDKAPLRAPDLHQRVDISKVRPPFTPASICASGFLDLLLLHCSAHFYLWAGSIRYLRHPMDLGPFGALVFRDLTAFPTKGVQRLDASVDRAKGYVRLSLFHLSIGGPAGVPKPLSISRA
jgi:hypothetical protein